ALSVAQIESEGRFFVSEELPALAVEDAALDRSNRYAFVGEFFRLPRLAVAAPGENRSIACEEQQSRFDRGQHAQHRTVGNHGETFRCSCVNDVGVAAGDGADFFWFWSRPEARGDCGIAKAEGAGGQE